MLTIYVVFQSRGLYRVPRVLIVNARSFHVSRWKKSITPSTSTTNLVCGLSFSRSQPDFEGFLRALRFSSLIKNWLLVCSNSIGCRTRATSSLAFWLPSLNKGFFVFFFFLSFLSTSFNTISRTSDMVLKPYQALNMWDYRKTQQESFLISNDHRIPHRLGCYSGWI